MGRTARCGCPPSQVYWTGPGRLDERDGLKKLLAAGVLIFAIGIATAAAAARPHHPSPKHENVPPISFGVADDNGKFAEDGGKWFDEALKGANLSEERWAMVWDPSNPTVIGELPFLVRSAPQAQADHVNVVLALYSKRSRYHNPRLFCGWAAAVASSVKQWGINDFIVGNEPNIRSFWVPQRNAKGKDVAAAAYEALLARCYDAIKKVNPNARVIGMGLSPHATNDASNHPLVFLRDVGKAYRASGRTTPIMDQLAIHPYPNPASPADPPWIGYRNLNDFGIPNLDRVKQAVWDAFHGTAQPTTLNGLTLRVDEVGWQVNTTSLAQYFGAETVRTVSAAQQAYYLRTMIESYFACDPSVTDVLLFHLIDEKYRGARDEDGNYVGGGWQSGLMTYGGPGLSQPRPAYAAVAADARLGRDACPGRTWITWRPGEPPVQPRAPKLPPPPTTTVTTTGTGPTVTTPTVPTVTTPTLPTVTTPTLPTVTTPTDPTATTKSP
jgi:hypothetical protein